MAYSTLQPGLSYFDLPAVGYLAYLDFHHPILARKGRRLVCADPICPADRTDELIASFLRDNRPAVFLQISQPVADILRRLGLRVNHFGVETNLPLADFNLRGKDKALLRHWRNKAVKEGVEVCEQPIDEQPWPEVEALSRDWLSGRPSQRELRLLTRPLVRDREEGVRYFWARWRGELVGLIVFDPVQRAGRTIGYYWNMVRTARRAPHGTSDLITLTAIDVFRAEKIGTMHFGLSPLTGLPKSSPRNCNRLTHVFLRLLHDYGGRFYGFANNFFHKQAYAGITREVFWCGTKGTTLGEVALVMKALGVV